MTAPTLSQQLQAVLWAKAHVSEIGKAARLREGEIAEMERRLDAAAETLQALVYERGTLR